MKATVEPVANLAPNCLVIAFTSLRPRLQQGFKKMYP
jgi:hypothetical protein